jgi:hypothetical protein
MKQLARRASLVVALLLFASVGTASAEGAWVLWLQVSRLKEEAGQQFHRFSVIRAYPTQRRCETDKPKDFVTGEGGPDYSRVNHICLPDTIDPRGPKGK